MSIGISLCKKIIFFASSAFTIGVGLYYVELAVLKALTGPQDSYPVFGAPYRMVTYHSAHPIQYIFLVAVVFGVFASLWERYFSTQKTWRRVLTIIVMQALVVVFSSIPGGVLWTLHDMQAGFFPSHERLFSSLLLGAERGFAVGWLVVLFSFPYNAICAAFTFLLTHYSARIFSIRLLKTSE